jgi:adenosylcobinamide-phosphate synthase
MAGLRQPDQLPVTHFYLLLMALLLDRLLGEPRRWHPLAGFGCIVHKLEQALLGQQGEHRHSPLSLRLRGALGATTLIAAPVAVLVWALHGLASLQVPYFPVINGAVEILVLYFCIGWRSLEQHGLAVWQGLRDNNLEAARRDVGSIVSRDTSQMSNAQAAQAATESVLENGNDALFAPVFWFLVGGAPAALLYRLANTLDAMWGYRTDRYRYFGWFAARLDDLLNLIPARLCAFSYSLAGNTRRAWACWRSQAKQCSSPNAGPVMTAGAGALQVQLGGPAVYHGTLTDKPTFGEGAVATATDILRACQLINRSLLLWLVVSGVFFALTVHGPGMLYGR